MKVSISATEPRQGLVDLLKDGQMAVILTGLHQHQAGDPLIRKGLLIYNLRSFCAFATTSVNANTIFVRMLPPGTQITLESEI